MVPRYMADSGFNLRPHRSRRQRPCDRCRSKKTACLLLGRGPCRSCERAGEPCTFVSQPTTRFRHKPQAETTTADNINIESTSVGGGRPHQDTYSISSPGHAEAPSEEIGHGDDESSQTQLWPSHTAISMNLMPSQHYHNSSPFETVGMQQEEALEFMPTSIYNTGIQHVQSIETLDHSNVQLCGTSAELDPWLLRHYKFDELGEGSHGRTRLRNVGGVPIEKMGPVHFTVVDDGVYEPLDSGTSFAAPLNVRRQELNSLVPPEQGLRLISLFFKFVFPEFPVVSRSRSVLLASNPENGLSGFPVVLLAAIYASAFPFSIHEPSLYLSTAYNDAPVDALWSFVHKLILENVHRPKLAVVQAGLLFMQQSSKANTQALNDSPVLWSFWASILALSNSLGLHLECRRWGIPSWEKRLRRRLWWAIYVEDTWRSFLSGRSPFIHPDEWDVSVLDELDFLHNISPTQALRSPLPAESLDSYTIFPHIIRLTLLVAVIYQTFYTLRASQKLSCDFLASTDAAKPIRVKLQSWYSNLPDDLRLRTDAQSNHESSRPRSRHGVAILQFCYLMSEVLLYRAILRTISPSPPPALIIRGEEEEGGEEGGEEDVDTDFSLIEQTNWEDLFLSDYNLEQLPRANITDSGVALDAMLNAAERCGGIVTQFVMGIGHKDFDAMWYGWSRLCFATMSNFITLLLVQAPNKFRATKAKCLRKLWLESLKRQYKQNCPLFTLGLVRLSTWPLQDLEQYFNLPQHVSEAIVGETTSDQSQDDPGWTANG